MSFNFGAPNPAGVTVNQPMSKDLRVTAIKLTNADFSTGGTASVKAALPVDASIVGMKLWVKTQLSGNGITAASLAVGTPAVPTQYIGAQSAFGVASTYTVIGSVANIMQDYNIPWSLDNQIQVTGTATTGNPTAGEMYLIIEWIR